MLASVSEVRVADGKTPVNFGGGMRKAFLMVLLALMSTSVAAEWIEVGSFKRYTLYVDPASIRKTGSIVNMSHLYDLHMIEEVAGKPYRSVVSKANYNCKNAKARRLYASASASNMGKGKVTELGGKIMTFRGRRKISSLSEPGKWKSIKQGSTEEMLWKFACGR